MGSQADLFQQLQGFLIEYQHLQDNHTHQEILSDFEEKISKGVDVNRALNRVIATH